MIKNITLSRFFEEVLETEVEVCGEEHDYANDDSCEIKGMIFSTESDELPLYFEKNTDAANERRYLETVYIANGRPIYAFIASSYLDYVGLNKEEKTMFVAWIIAQLKMIEREAEK